MGETRVDLAHLLGDLRDAYPGSVEETIVTEIVANALDSGTKRITVSTDPVAATLTVVDDGKGMTRAAMSRYHDLASTSKRRGRSIGFAGVGIKLGLLVADDVVTETCSRRTHVATSWRLSAKNRAPWRWIEPPGIVPTAGTDGEGATGTAVRLYLTNTLSPLLEPGFVERVILDHFRPLFDPDFDEILAPFYPEGIGFRVNGRSIPRTDPEPERIPLRVRIGRQRRASGVGYLVSDPQLGDDERGVAVSTLGKVIKRGWDWLGLAPGETAVAGLVEIPALAEVLTLNKADFLRSGQRGATFLAYRKAIQEPVARLLAELGDAPSPATSRRPRTRSLERDFRSVLSDLTDAFPLIATLVERTPGGQRRLALGGEAPVVTAGATAAAPDADPTAPGAGDSGPPSVTDPGGAPDPGAPDPEAREPAAAGTVPAAGGRKRPATLGVSIRFESRPDDPAPGRLVESTVWVNEAHPAYRRALASRSEGYHIAVAVALALAPLAVQPAEVATFVTAFLARWGEAATNGARR